MSGKGMPTGPDILAREGRGGGGGEGGIPAPTYQSSCSREAQKHATDPWKHDCKIYMGGFGEYMTRTHHSQGSST